MREALTIQPAVAKLRRHCLWALLAVLPAAFALRAHEQVRDWWRASELFAQPVAPGEPAMLAGAEWRVASLQRVAERPDGSVAAWLKLEAVVQDPALLNQVPCRITLATADGRRWLPSFVTPREIGRLAARQRETATTCGAALLRKPETGATLQISEGFVLPRAAFENAEVVVSLPGGRPRYLRFLRRP